MVKFLAIVSDKVLARFVPSETAVACNVGEYRCEYFGTHSRLLRMDNTCHWQYVCGDCC